MRSKDFFFLRVVDSRVGHSLLPVMTGYNIIQCALEIILSDKPLFQSKGMV